MPNFAAFIPGLMVSVILGTWALTALPFLFVMLRWRTQGAGEPGLGLRAGLMYFRTVASFAMTACAALILFTWMSKEPQDTLSRTVLGVGGASFVFWLLQAVCSVKLGPADSDLPVGRVFGGFGLMLTGIMLFAGLLIVCVAIAQKGKHEEEIKLGAAFAVVFGASFALRFLLMSPRTHSS